MISCTVLIFPYLFFSFLHVSSFTEQFQHSIQKNFRHVFVRAYSFLHMIQYFIHKNDCLQKCTIPPGKILQKLIIPCIAHCTVYLSKQNWEASAFPSMAIICETLTHNTVKISSDLWIKIVSVLLYQFLCSKIIEKQQGCVWKIRP